MTRIPARLIQKIYAEDPGQKVSGDHEARHRRALSTKWEGSCWHFLSNDGQCIPGTSPGMVTDGETLELGVPLEGCRRRLRRFWNDWH